MHGRWEMCKKFWSEDEKKRAHLEDIGIYGRIMLKWILKREDGTTELIWQTLVNTEINFWTLQK
jgi:hypothetical protein